MAQDDGEKQATTTTTATAATNLRKSCTSSKIDLVASGLILGIESSCDETSAAVVRGGREALSNVVASQLVHGDYGGVVPELASREH